MHPELLYLRSNVKIEPLIDSWYAWPHLIPPATAARNVTERHLKIMDSYINAPDVHARAVKDPRMLGGPFIDYRGERVEEITALRNRTVRDRQFQIDLSNAINKLGAMLRTTPRGLSLQPLYSEIPAILCGYIELVYDLNHHASFRLIEPLLYSSKYYERGMQSLTLSLINDDDRPFVLSTPRLPCPESLEIKIPFDNELVDWIFELKRRPKAWSEIRSAICFSDRQEDLFRSLFSTTPSRPYEAYGGTGIRWRYFGHACLLVESAEVRILFDPVLSYTYESSISRYTYEDLPDTIDFVMITHGHPDHILLETLLQLRQRVNTFVVPHNRNGALQDPSLKLLLEKAGCKNVIELAEMQTITFEGGSVTGLPFFGEHADLDILSKIGYLVRLGRRSLAILADSCNIEPALYEHIHGEVGPVEALFIGMECDGAPLSWLYGPLFLRTCDRVTDESRRLAGCNYDQAMRIVDTFGCKDVYVYAMGQEPWLNYVMSIKYSPESRPIVDSDRLIVECRRRGINAERLFGEKEIFISR
jgi:L-ascorbate metabolism protein UlaG (beta-lactamase superfamily)